MRAAATCLVFVACASAGDKAPTDGAGGDDAPMRGPTECPAGQFAVDVSVADEVTCGGVDAASAIVERCSVYYGWRDGCDGCTTAPAKWGFANTTSCTNGAGVNNTCTAPNLGGATVQLFGLDPDGDVDGNDKLYGSLHCVAGEPAAGLAPCPAGQIVVGKLGSSWTCAAIVDTAVAYVRDNCSLYLGWQDGCNGCTNPPVKWGHAGDKICENGAGADNTCSVAQLGGESINLFGLSPDGDVDGNDKLHVGLDCLGAATERSTATSTCPAGQFVTGTLSEGSFQCESIAPLVAQFFRDHCTLFFGWQDGCDGCLTPPSKFGNVRVGLCSLGVGTDDTCSTFTLGAASVAMFGLSPDGDVDGNDALKIGFQCQ